MAFKTGSKNVTTHGTRVPLTSTNNYYTSLTLQMKDSNTKNIFIGDKTVSSTVYGFKLGASDTVTLVSGSSDSINTAQIFIDSEADSEGVTWGGISR